MATIQITHPASPAALYRRYPGEHYPQPTHITLRLDTGLLAADYHAKIIEGNGPDTLHGRRGLTITWPIPALTGDAATGLLDLIAPDCQRILDHATIRPTSDEPAGVGSLDAAGLTLVDQVGETIDQYAADAPLVDVLDLAALTDDEQDEALQDYPVTADTTDAELDALVAAVETELPQVMDGVVVVERAREVLAGRREAARLALETELGEVADQIALATHRRDELIHHLPRLGYSHRAIGERAGLSHTRVGTILRTDPYVL